MPDAPYLCRYVADLGFAFLAIKGLVDRAAVRQEFLMYCRDLDALLHVTPRANTTCLVSFALSLEQISRLGVSMSCLSRPPSLKIVRSWVDESFPVLLLKVFFARRPQ